MAAPSYTTDLTDVTTAETTTGWSEMSGRTFGGAPTQETDYYIQGTACISQSVGGKTGTQVGLEYDYGSDITAFTDGVDCFFFWQVITAGNAMDTFANGGLRLCVGSTTGNVYCWISGGNNFGRNPYGGWQNIAIDPTYTPDFTDGTPTASNYRIFASYPNLLSAISKGNPHGVDAIRWGRGELIIEFGDASNGYGTFVGLATENDYNDVTNGYNRWGLFQKQGTGYLWKGLMSFGNTTNASDFRDSNANITVENTPRTYASFNKIEINNASSRVDWTGVNITALSATQLSRGSLQVVDNADVNFDTNNFTDMNTFIFQSNSTVLDTTFRRCALVTQGGAVFDGSIFTNSTNPTSLLVSNLDNIDNCDFIRPTTTTSSYAESNQDSGTNMYTGTTVGVAQSFTGVDLILYQCRFYLRKTGSPTGNATAYLYAHTGTYGTSSAPTGTALATSATFDVSTLTTSYQLISFTFATPYELDGSTNYTIAVQYAGGNASNYVTVGTDTSAPTHGGNAATYNGTNWTASSTTDAIFYVNTNHAIELTNAHAGGSFTLAGCTYTNYATSNGSTGNEAIYNNSGGAVTINVPSGDVPTYRNGTGATTTIVSSKTIDVHVQDEATDPIQSAQVAIYNSTTDAQIFNNTTNASGDITQTSAATNTPLYIRVRKSTTGTRYYPVETVATLSDNLSLTITMTEDTTAQ